MFYTLPWKVCLYSLWRIDPAVSNQPTSYDELTLPWGWFVTSRNIFKPFYVHSCQSSMQTVYSISWPRGYWISTYKILCCAINIKGLWWFCQNHVEPTPPSLNKPCLWYGNPKWSWLFSRAWLDILICIFHSRDAVKQWHAPFINIILSKRLFRGLRPFLEGFAVPMHEGVCEIGSLANVDGKHTWNVPLEWKKAPHCRTHLQIRFQLRKLLVITMHC